MKYIIIFLFSFLIIGCSNKSSIVVSSTKSQVELREMQTQRINSSDALFVSKVILQVLQDDEFIIENADQNLGFFSGKKKLDGGKEKYEFAWYDVYYPIAIYKLSTLENLIKEVRVTISIRKFDEYLSVRASFNSDLINPDGKMVDSRVIDDLKFYQDFFAKLDKALFLEKNNL
jgi:hypothetical protein